MEEIEISIDVIRIQTMIHAIHTDRLNDQQLTRLTRYLFSDEFPQEFIELDNSELTGAEKQKEFQRIYARSTTPLQVLN